MTFLGSPDVRARAKRYPVVGFLLGLTTVIPALIGISLQLSSDQIEKAHSYHAVLVVAPLHVWTGLFVITSLMMVLSIMRGLSASQVASLAVSGLFAIFAFLIAWSTFFNHGISIGIISFLGLSGMAAITSMACGEPIEKLHLPYIAHHDEEST